MDALDLVGLPPKQEARSQGWSYVCTKGGNGAPWPNGKKKGHKIFKLGLAHNLD